MSSHTSPIGAAEIDRSLREFWANLKSSTIGFGRGSKVPLVLSDKSHCEPGIATVGGERNGSLKRRGGIVGADPAQTQTELEPRIGLIGPHFGSCAVGANRVNGASKRFQQHTAPQVQCDRRRCVSRSREREQRRLGLIGSFQRGAEQAPPLRVIRELVEQPRKQCSCFRIAEFEQRHAGQESSVGSVGRKNGGAAKESSGSGEVFRRARGTPRDDERRDMVGTSRKARGR
jgi:hypothetical protein